MHLKNYSFQRKIIDCLYLCSHSEDHREYSVALFQRYFIYPILRNKILIFYDENDKPVGLATWVFFSEYQSEKFLDERYIPSEMDYEPEDGEEFWGVELIAPFGHVRQVWAEIRKTYRSRYGKKRPIYWRRLYAPKVKHKGAL